jgi:hypothetical protein
MAKSYTTLRNLWGTLSQNTSAANLALGDQLMNDAHRYLLQKYFSNETTYSIPTAGGTTSTLTGTLSSGAVSATLNSAWTGNTTKIQVTFSNGQIRMARFENSSTAISWDVPLTSSTTTDITIGAQQFYPVPPNYSKLKSITITVGNLQWTINEVFTTQEWNQINVFPYYSDIPQFFFVFPGGDRSGQIGIWPIPSTTGNIITFSYKFRVPDLSLSDYTTSTVSVTQNSTQVTGSATSFITTTNYGSESRWIQIAQNKGDNLWYQIASVDSTTGLTLYQPYQGITVSGGSYTIGQMPLLPEDFHDMPVYKALVVYFSSINKDMDKAKSFETIYNEKLRLLEEYSGSNTIQVNLREAAGLRNPNTYPQSIGGSP